MSDRITVASLNPVKIEAARRAFARVFPDTRFEVSGISVPSHVPAQPMSDAETYQGAYNRATNAKNAIPDAHYWVGIEGGIEMVGAEMWGVAWMVVLGQVNGETRLGKGRTATFIVPHQVAALIHQGYEMGAADDLIFQRQNSKQGNGAVGILTGDAITRVDYYEHALILALLPFKNPDLDF